MKKQQKNNKKGKVQKSAKPAARKKPVAKKTGASPSKKKPAKKTAAAKPVKKMSAKKPVKNVPAPKAKAIKKVVPPKAAKPEKKVVVAKDKAKKPEEIVNPEIQRPIQRPLTDRPINEKKAALFPQGEKVKLRIDARTIITVRSKEALKMWMQRYPNAVQED